MDSSKTILLWGDSQVGKTTWIAAALYGASPPLALIDRNASADALAEVVAPHWRNLRQGRYIDPTEQTKINLPLVVQGLGTVHLRDIKGGNVHQIHRNDIRAELIKDAAAFLVLAEWRGRTIDRQMEAIEPLLDFVGDRPSGLVFTKCERYLAADDDAWSLRPGWWRREDWLSPFHAILERFGERIWPVSAYGYCQNDFAEGLPAVIAGEFGQLMPYRIAPQGVAAPLQWILGALGRP